MPRKKQEKPKGFTAWYKENKDERNRRRREKYAQDPAYREASLSRTKDWVKSTRKPRVRVPKEGAAPHRFATPRVVQIAGAEVKVVSGGQLAAELVYSHDTIMGWRKDGLLPPSTSQDARGHHWYSQDYVAAMKLALEDMKLLPWTHSRFREAAFKRWGETDEGRRWAASGGGLELRHG